MLKGQLGEGGHSREGQQHETRQRGEMAEGLKAATSSMVLVEHAVQNRSGW